HPISGATLTRAQTGPPAGIGRQPPAWGDSLCARTALACATVTTEEWTVEDEHPDTRTSAAKEIGQTGPHDPVAQRRTERNARIAVTIFPLLVIAGGVIGFLGSDSISALAPTIPWGIGVIMFFMGVTLTLPDFARIAKRPWVVALGTGSQFIVMP